GVAWCTPPACGPADARRWTPGAGPPTHVWREGGAPRRRPRHRAGCRRTGVARRVRPILPPGARRAGCGAMNAGPDRLTGATLRCERRFLPVGVIPVTVPPIRPGSALLRLG